jgi:hypothetical protein
MECKISSLRAQSTYSNYVLCIIHILLYLENYSSGRSPPQPGNNCAHPTAQAQPSPRPCRRGGVHYCRLYQISHLPVKYNLLVMYWHAFLIKLRINTERAGDTPLSWCNFFKIWRTCSIKTLKSIFRILQKAHQVPIFKRSGDHLKDDPP